MKILICTSNATRHRYVANALGSATDETLIISECRQQDSSPNKNDEIGPSLLTRSLIERFETEDLFFCK